MNKQITKHNTTTHIQSERPTTRRRVGREVNSRPDGSCVHVVSVEQFGLRVGSGGGIARAENGRERERKGGAYVQKQIYN